MCVIMRGLAFVLALFLTIPVALATPLEYYETVADLGAESSEFTFLFLFETAPDGSLEYVMPFAIKDMGTSANFGEYKCNYETRTKFSRIFCDFSNVSEGGRALNIKFSSEEAVNNLGEMISFNADIRTPQDVKRMVVKAVLKEGFILIKEPEGTTNVVPYSPKEGKEGSDGRKIFVEWERLEVKRGEGIDVSVNYEKIASVVQTDQNIVFLFIGILILVIAIAVGLGGREKKEMDTSILKQDEKKVFEIINEKGGMCKQRVIVAETDFSKAKVSRLIKDLEERGLIRTEKSGRSKKIYVNTKTETD